MQWRVIMLDTSKLSQHKLPSGNKEGISKIPIIRSKRNSIVNTIETCKKLIESSDACLKNVDLQESTSHVKEYINGRKDVSVHPVRSACNSIGYQIHEKEYKANPLPKFSNETFKHNKSSLKRLEKVNESMTSGLGDRVDMVNDGPYLTPLQRKEMTIRELANQVDSIRQAIIVSEKELDEFKQYRHAQRQEIEEQHIKKVEELKNRHDLLVKEKEQLSSAQNVEKAKLMELQENLQVLKGKNEDRQKINQNLYLEIYMKGKKSALFEREADMEITANSLVDPKSSEIVNNYLAQLNKTQKALNYWQNLKPNQKKSPIIMNSFKGNGKSITQQSGPTTTDGDNEEDDDENFTEEHVEALLSFLKDSMFYYLTEPKRDIAEKHLNVLINSFYYTDEQRKKIMNVVNEKRKRGKL